MTNMSIYHLADRNLLFMDDFTFFDYKAVRTWVFIADIWSPSRYYFTTCVLTYRTFDEKDSKQY